MLFAPIKLCQPPHFVGRELKIEYFRIFLDVSGIARARDHRDVTLQIPAQNDLGSGLSVSAADPDDLWVLENGGGPTSAAERKPALHDDSLLLHEGNDVLFLVEGMNFVLHESGRCVDLRQKVGEFLHVPIGESDRAHELALHRLFDRTVSRNVALPG